MSAPTLQYITTNHIGGKHVIVQMDDFAVVATFQPGEPAAEVAHKLRRLAADIEVLSAMPSDRPSPLTLRPLPVPR